jgi:hypothetical protein
MYSSAVPYHLSCQGYRQLEAGCQGLKVQKYKPFLALHSYNYTSATERPHISCVFSLVTSSVGAFCRSVTKHKIILCELYVDTYSEVADDCGN